MVVFIFTINFHGTSSTLCTHWSWAGNEYLETNTWKMLLKVGSELLFHPLELFHKTSFKLNFFMNTM